MLLIVPPREKRMQRRGGKLLKLHAAFPVAGMLRVLVGPFSYVLLRTTRVDISRKGDIAS